MLGRGGAGDGDDIAVLEPAGDVEGKTTKRR